jgi:hypothetical protein
LFFPASSHYAFGKNTRFGIIESLGGQRSCGGRRHAVLWSAPAERSGDGALDRLRAGTETPSPVTLENPKRRGAPLPAALQKAGRDDDAILPASIFTGTQLRRKLYSALLLWGTQAHAQTRAVFGAHKAVGITEEHCSESPVRDDRN